MRYKGMRSGKLELVKKLRSGGRGVGAVWRAVCDCGNTPEVLARKVADGTRKSCGNCGRGLGMLETEKTGIPAGMKIHFHRIVQQKHIGPVPVDKFVALKGKRCIICNTQEGTLPEWNDERISFIPLCRACTRARGGGKLTELLEWIMRVASRVRDRLDQ